MAKTRLSASQTFPANLLTPAVPCPSCQEPVRGFAGQRLTNQAAYYDGPGGAKTYATAWTLWPCGCEVDQFWAGAFSQEMRRRSKGQQPREVEVLWALKQDQRRTAIQRNLAQLYERQATAVAVRNVVARQEAELEILRLMQELQPLLPKGTHAADTLAPIALLPSTVVWASSYHYAMPKSARAVDLEVPLDVTRIEGVLLADDAYANRTVVYVRDLAGRIYAQLQAHLRDGSPLDALARAVLSRCLRTGADLTAPLPVTDYIPDSVAEQLRQPRRRLLDLGSEPTQDD